MPSARLTSSVPAMALAALAFSACGGANGSDASVGDVATSDVRAADGSDASWRTQYCTDAGTDAGSEIAPPGAVIEVAQVESGDISTYVERFTAMFLAAGSATGRTVGPCRITQYGDGRLSFGDLTLTDPSGQQHVFSAGSGDIAAWYDRATLDAGGLGPFLHGGDGLEVRTTGATDGVAAFDATIRFADSVFIREAVWPYGFANVIYAQHATFRWDPLPDAPDETFIFRMSGNAGTVDCEFPIGDGTGTIPPEVFCSAPLDHVWIGVARTVQFTAMNGSSAYPVTLRALDVWDPVAFIVE